MPLRYILFDLDGTLLPMDQNTFVQAYFKLLAQKLAPYGYDPQDLVDAIWKGTAAMVSNDGHWTNETAFWDRFSTLLGERSRKDQLLFDEYYHQEFQQVRKVCGFTAHASQVTDKLKDQGYKLVLATNPIFPAIATESRMKWAGLEPEDFIFYTTYENSSHCKPNPDYYRDILAKLGAQAEECLMVGNDVEEDMVAATLGMRVFLLTDCLINKFGKDISQFPNGSFDTLMEYIQTLS